MTTTHVLCENASLDSPIYRELVAAYIAVKDNPTNTYSPREYAGFMLALLGDDAIVACSSRQPWMSDDDWSFRQQAGKVIAAAMQEEAS